MTRIAILGSTGSIGTSALDVARTHADRIEVVAIAAATNVALMAKQVLEFRPRAVGMASGDAMDKLRAVLGGSPAEICGVGNDGLIELATRELAELGLVPAGAVIDGTVIRQPKAYPVYDGEYSEALEVIKGWLGQFENLQVVGRNGMHRYNNQDHSMLTAMLAARNIVGERHDLWNVNVERSYHEEFQVDRKTGAIAVATA